MKKSKLQYFLLFVVFICLSYYVYLFVKADTIKSNIHVVLVIFSLFAFIPSLIIVCIKNEQFRNILKLILQAIWWGT